MLRITNTKRILNPLTLSFRQCSLRTVFIWVEIYPFCRYWLIIQTRLILSFLLQIMFIIGFSSSNLIINSYKNDIENVFISNTFIFILIYLWQAHIQQDSSRVGLSTYGFYRASKFGANNDYDSSVVYIVQRYNLSDKLIRFNSQAAIIIIPIVVVNSQFKTDKNEEEPRFIASRISLFGLCTLPLYTVLSLIHSLPPRKDISILTMQRYSYSSTIIVNEVVSKSNAFGVEAINTRTEIYLYLGLPHWVQRQEAAFSIKMIQETDKDMQETNRNMKETARNMQETTINTMTLFQYEIDLYSYIKDHQLYQKTLWTQLFQSQQVGLKFIVKQRVFLKSTRFQLDDLIGSSQRGQQHDYVQIKDLSPLSKNKKIPLSITKSMSFGNHSYSLSTPMRLDTISEEDTIFKTNLKMESTLDQNHIIHPQIIFSQNYCNEKDFQLSLEKQNSQIDKRSRQLDQEFVYAFDQQKNVDKRRRQDFRVKGLQRQYGFLGSNLFYAQQKLSSQKQKNTEKSQNQMQYPSFSFLDKSSLISEQQISQLNISQGQELMFKLKTVIFIVIVLFIAILASFSTDSFSISKSEHKKSLKMSKRQYKGNQKIGKIRGRKRQKEKSQQKMAKTKTEIHL